MPAVAPTRVAPETVPVRFTPPRALTKGMTRVQPLPTLEGPAPAMQASAHVPGQGLRSGLVEDYAWFPNDVRAGAGDKYSQGGMWDRGGRQSAQKGEWTNDDHLFTKVEGSFTDAVRAAQLRARTGAAKTWIQAQAVVQGSDGGFYVTALGHNSYENGPEALVVDGHFQRETPTVPAVVIPDYLRALNPAVKAVVGADAWANFSRRQLRIAAK
jgi:hypothetical protein